VTLLLERWRSGDRQALDELMPLVYDELGRLASHYMRSERPSHTLQATALVNEAYLRLAGASVTWQSRAHFFAVAARLLRRILVDHAKAHRREKRGGGGVKVTLNEAVIAPAEAPPDIVALDDALQRLGEIDSRKSRLIELHFFGGLTYAELAETMEISEATVHRELRLAKAWLHHELKGGETP
jgi:RNA polymerase sigma factor (TIGR02999 family)